MLQSAKKVPIQQPRRTALPVVHRSASTQARLPALRATQQLGASATVDQHKLRIRYLRRDQNYQVTHQGQPSHRNCHGPLLTPAALPSGVVAALLGGCPDAYRLGSSTAPLRVRCQLLCVPLSCRPGGSQQERQCQLVSVSAPTCSSECVSCPELVAAGGRRDAPTGTWRCSRVPTRWASRSTEGRTRQQVRQARAVTAAAAPAKALVHVQSSADEQKRVSHASTLLMLQTHRVPSVSHKSVVGFVCHQKESTSRGTRRSPPPGAPAALPEAGLLTPCLCQARCRCRGACSSSYASC
jgi:hypothetical protein